MAKFGIGARVVGPDGPGEIMDKRKGERLVRPDNKKLPLQWFPKSLLCLETSESAYSEHAPATDKWVLKVGDRVRFTSECEVTWWFGPDTKDAEGVITSDEPYGRYTFTVTTDSGDKAYVNAEHIEPVVAPATTTAEAWTPKVGDRVNWTRVRGEYDGSIVEAHDGIFDFKLRAANGNHTYAFAHELEPAHLTIEAGKFYRTRDGRKVGPLTDGDLSEWVFEAQVDGKDFADGTRCAWRDDGSFDPSDATKEHRLDLVAEWVDEPVVAVENLVDVYPEPVAVAEATATPAERKFEVGDRVVAVKGACLLNEGQQYEILRYEDDAPVVAVDLDGDLVEYTYGDDWFEPAPAPITLTISAKSEPVADALRTIAAALNAA